MRLQRDSSVRKPSNPQQRRYRSSTERNTSKTKQRALKTEGTVLPRDRRSTATPRTGKAQARQNDIQARRIRIVVGAAVCAVVLAIPLAIFVFGGSEVENAQSSDSASIMPSETLQAGFSALASGVESTEQRIASFKEYYFYESDRSDRYLAYQELYPDLTDEQILIRVNVDLDLPAYDAVTQVEDPTALGVLITKHHCLPYDYVPHDLVQYESFQMSADVVEPLQELIAAAAADGVPLSVTSAYRSAEYQDSLYQGYVAQIGFEWAEIQSAHGGHSEHQTGRAIDFNPADYRFYDTVQEAWLEENAYRFGFIVRYAEGTEDVSLYIHEPWHVRYVGTDISNGMHETGINSYEEYWVKYIRHTPPDM